MRLALLLLWAPCVALAQPTGTGQSSRAALTAPRLSHGELYVDGKPFIILGGELGNSTASSPDSLRAVWPRLQAQHLNTLIAPVYWELMEPAEGHFDFALVHDLITGARAHGLKLVLLWFGTWKNSMSCYAPDWIKTHTQRFPRARTAGGEAQEIITPFSTAALAADKRAFAALMRYVRSVDRTQHTVLMVQVENEIGMLPEARDHSAAADSAFAAPVPERLLAGMADSAPMAASARMAAAGGRAAGSWSEVFGAGPATDEVFMAWFFGVYANEVAGAGKREYDIPMYVNAALNRPGAAPGKYPSGGPLPHLFQVWKVAAPDIDILSPDFYNPDFTHWCDLYSRPDNPLFIPEHRFEPGVDIKAMYAIGHYHAIGLAPFSIESEAVPIGPAYTLLSQLSGEIAAAKKRGMLDAVMLSREADSVHLTMGDYVLTVAHDRTLPWGVKGGDWPLTGGIIVGLSAGEFYVAGTGLVVTFQPRTPGARAGILRIEEGTFVHGVWRPVRRLNGDQDHQGRHLRIPEGTYAIQRVALYTYR